jgi:DNA-binding NtrC family response regulator
MNYPWPGNIRELQNTLETAVLFAEKGLIVPPSLQFKPALFGKSPMTDTGRPSPGTHRADEEESPPPDLEKILVALREQGFHRGNAAKALGMSRRHLYRKLEQYGVSPDSKTLRAAVGKWLR